MYPSNQSIQNQRPSAATTPISRNQAACHVPRGHETLPPSAASTDHPTPFASIENRIENQIENDTAQIENGTEKIEKIENDPLAFPQLTDFFRKIFSLLGAKCTFKNLNEHQHERLLEWLRIHEYKDVCALVAAQPPQGFDIKCTISSLWRYSEKIMPLYLDNLRQVDLDVAASLPSAPDESIAKMEAATLRGFRHRLFKMSIDSSDPAKIRSLYSVFHKLADQSLANRRLVLLEKRAAQADQTEQVLLQPLPPEERHRRLKQIFGLQ